MLKSILTRIFARRHFWRYATFSEVAELYAAKTMRVIALNLGSGFASVYLYKTGYSLEFILGFWALFYIMKAFVAVPAGIFAAKVGSKKGILVANILYIPAMIALGFVPDAGIPALIIAGVCMGISGTLHEICYFVEFSRVKSMAHAGKEIGFMNILEKIAIGVSPVIGGFIALIFSPSVTMWTAGLLFVFAAAPLFRTADRVERHQRIAIKGFPWKMALPSMYARVGVGFDIVATGTVWGLFIAVVIFPNFNNEIYVVLGILASITIVVAIASSYIFGKLIDNRRGGLLLRVGVIADSLIHVSRAAVATPAGVVGVNITDEVATTAQAMAFTRGMFDTADLSGHRVMYLMGIEILSMLGASLACGTFLLCITLSDSIEIGMRIFFVIAALAILLIMTARFQLYRK
jgi:MFS family permease